MRCRTPTWVAASPTPWASCMSVVMRSTSRRTSSSTSSISRAFIRSTGVAVLADAGEREHAPRLELERALVAARDPRRGRGRGRARARGRSSAASLASERLGIDVDDDCETVAAHRGGGRHEQRRGAVSERARRRRLRDELHPVTAAQAQKRSRPEDVDARHCAGRRVALAGRASALTAQSRRRRWRRGA